MISYEESQDFLIAAARARRWPRETVRLQDAVGRVCADRVLSPEPSPPFNNSSMDGFAIRAELTAKASPTTPLKFKVGGTVAAGHAVPAVPKDADYVFEIMTGAPIPDAFDAVAKIEDVLVERNENGLPCSVTLTAPLTRSQNVRYRGHDFAEGHPILEPGTLIRADHLMGLASLGVTRLEVFRKPRAAVISTGHEIRPFDSASLEPGQIRNSSGPYLAEALPALGFDVVLVTTAEDDIDDFLKAFDAASALKPDLIMSTGAVSMGRYDFIKDALAKRDAKPVFHKVAIRPGKPILFAELTSGAAFFGLPGNPISTVVGLRFFVMPFQRALFGLAPEKQLEATLTANFEKPQPLRCFMKARLKFTADAGLTVQAHAGQPSFMISSLNESNVWAIAPAGVGAMEAGAKIKILPLLPGAWEMDIA